MTKQLDKQSEKVTDQNEKKYIAYRIPGDYDSSDRLFTTLVKAVLSLIDEDSPACDSMGTSIYGIVSEGGEISFEKCDISDFFIRVPASKNRKKVLKAEAKKEISARRKGDDDWVENSIMNLTAPFLATGCCGIHEVKFEKWTDEQFKERVKETYRLMVDKEEIQWNKEKLGLTITPSLSYEN